jgi:hypothetical protein
MKSATISGVLSTAFIGAAVVTPQVAANPYVGPDDAHVQFFRSPSGNIECEIDFQRAPNIPDRAYCMSMKPLQNVQIRSDGSLAGVCTDDVSCGSNGPQDQAVLPYGQSAALGAFTCISEESGMTCTANGRGFNISTAGIVPV